MKVLNEQVAGVTLVCFLGTTSFQMKISPFFLVFLCALWWSNATPMNPAHRIQSADQSRANGKSPIQHSTNNLAFPMSYRTLQLLEYQEASHHQQQYDAWRARHKLGPGHHIPFEHQTWTARLPIEHEAMPSTELTADTLYNEQGTKSYNTLEGYQSFHDLDRGGEPDIPLGPTHLSKGSSSEGTRSRKGKYAIEWKELFPSGSIRTMCNIIAERTGISPHSAYKYLGERGDPDIGHDLLSGNEEKIVDAILQLDLPALRSESVLKSLLGEEERNIITRTRRFYKCSYKEARKHLELYITPVISKLLLSRSTFKKGIRKMPKFGSSTSDSLREQKGASIYNDHSDDNKDFITEDEEIDMIAQWLDDEELNDSQSSDQQVAIQKEAEDALLSSRDTESNNDSATNFLIPFRGKILQMASVIAKHTDKSTLMAYTYLRRNGCREIVKDLLSGDPDREEAAVKSLNIPPKKQGAIGKRLYYWRDRAADLTRAYALFHGLSLPQSRKILDRNLDKEAANLMLDYSTFVQGASLIPPTGKERREMRKERAKHLPMSDNRHVKRDQ